MRVKGGVKARRRHNRILHQVEGYFGARSKHYRRAHEAYLHAGQYAFTGRKDRKAQFRRLWIQRIRAALSEHGWKYSRFIQKLKEKNIILDRKVLSHFSSERPAAFAALLKLLE